VATYQWAITIGLLIAAIVNNGTKNKDNASAYQIPIALQFVWALILAGGMFFLPEVGISLAFSKFSNPDLGGAIVTPLADQTRT
jgi:hypothetical protein